jgi:hypothetical protein
MKSIYVIAILLIFSSATAHADEMIVHLKSGNSVIIQYTGIIESVKLEGSTDAIAGMNMKNAAKPQTSSRNDDSPKQTSSINPAGKKEKIEKKNKKIGVRWADPISED